MDFIIKIMLEYCYFNKKGIKMKLDNLKYAGIITAESLIGSFIAYKALSSCFDTENGLSRKICKLFSLVIGTGAALALNGIRTREIGVIVLSAWSIMNPPKLKSFEID